MNYIDALDLTKNEYKIVNVLISHGQLDVKTITWETGLQRRIVYDILDKLSRSGLIAQAIQNDKTYFSLALENYLIDISEKEKEREEAIKQLIKMTVVSARGELKPGAHLFLGIHATKQLLLAQINSGLDYFSLGAAKKSLDLLGDYFWLNYNLKQEKLKTNGKIIFNESLREWSKQIKSRYRYIRFLKKGLEPMTQIFIYGDRTLTIIWADSPVAILIENNEVARSYKLYFNILWKSAKG